MYSMIFGGVHLFKEGKHITVASPMAMYNDLDFKHVQGLWRIMQQPDVQAKLAELNKLIGDKLTKLGDAFGLESNKMTKDDLSEIERIFA